MGSNLNTLTYGKCEEFIKTYRYYSTSTKDKEVGEVERSLIITTKRIVLESTNKSGFSRDEIPVELIDKVYTNFYRSKKSMIGLTLLIFGVITAALSLLIGSKLDVVFSRFNYALIGFGSFLIVLGLLYLILKKSKQAFKLTFFSTKQFYNFSSISGENYMIRERKAKKQAKKIKVISKVTPAAVVMLNELNALLIDIKDFNFQISYAKEMVLKKVMTLEEYENHYSFLLSRIINSYK